MNKKEREPVWNASPKILVFDKNFTKNTIIVLNNDSTQIKDNIYAQELTIWNAGDLPIDINKDIRVPIRLVFSDSVKLIEYEILNEKGPNKNNFSLNMRGDSLELSWKYFDPKYGLKIRHIYSSKNKGFPIIEGSVLGNDLKRVQINKSYWGKLGGLLAFFFFGALTLYAVMNLVKDVLRDKKVEDIFLLLFWFSFFILLVYLLFQITLDFINHYESPF
ncbi:MAG: hypothetical protein L3J20_03110 [Flavobacteriaceae bacterium]|nr:hypothetical protein [Flavobacteriaceae bacterium]